jgi:5-hydroxyisourate hydrolase
MSLSTHVLDVEAGRPASGVPVVAQRFGPEPGLEEAGTWQTMGSGTTDDDGRVGALVAAEVFVPGRWRVVFDTAVHHGPHAFFPQVTIEFAVPAPDGDGPVPHLHVPLLLARHGYTTYRGS